MANINFGHQGASLNKFNSVSIHIYFLLTLLTHSSGSDVASMTTRATLSEDGKHYLLNGSKVGGEPWAWSLARRRSSSPPPPPLRCSVLRSGSQTEAGRMS